MRQDRVMNDLDYQLKRLVNAAVIEELFTPRNTLGGVGNLDHNQVCRRVVERTLSGGLRPMSDAAMRRFCYRRACAQQQPLGGWLDWAIDIGSNALDYGGDAFSTVADWGMSAFDVASNVAGDSYAWVKNAITDAVPKAWDSVTGWFGAEQSNSTQPNFTAAWYEQTGASNPGDKWSIENLIGPVTESAKNILSNQGVEVIGSAANNLLKAYVAKENLDLQREAMEIKRMQEQARQGSTQSAPQSSTPVPYFIASGGGNGAPTMRDSGGNTGGGEISTGIPAPLMWGAAGVVVALLLNEANK